MEITDAVAVVTGGTGGLGRRICWALASRGAHVVAVYLTSAVDPPAAADAWAAELSALGPRAVAVAADVTQPEQVQGMVERVLREFGRLDILVNNAAINQLIPYKDLDALTLDVWNRMLRLNLTAPFMLSKAVAPAMLRQQRGHIVNIASTAGLGPTGSSIAYAVAKASLIHLTRCLAVALAPHVLVNAVAPGLIEGSRTTDNLGPAFVANSKRISLLGRAADKDDVADQVVTYVRSASTTGQTVVVDCGRFFH